MLQEFKAFIARGNVIDLAVGLIMGATFTAIVTSLVNDMLMPPIGMLMGGVSFNDLFFSLDGQSYPSLEVARAAGAPVIAYGAFIQTVINFLLVGLAVFFLVKAVNKLYKAKPEVELTSEEKLLTEIRDILKTRS